MITFIEGKLADRDLTRAVVQTQGIGYEVLIPLGVSEKLPAVGELVRLYTHHHIREDIQQLFGFLNKEERDFFKKLISVSGIGPKVGLGLLGGLKVEELQQAILAEDIALISSAPGIGKKTAQRLVLELKGKVTGHQPQSKESHIWNEALLALISLGYNQSKAQDALAKTAKKHKETMTLEELVRKSLNYV